MSRTGIVGSTGIAGLLVVGGGVRSGVALEVGSRGKPNEGLDGSPDGIGVGGSIAGCIGNEMDSPS